MKTWQEKHVINKVIVATNAIESLNSALRKILKKRKLFPTEYSAKKVVYLAIQGASKKGEHADQKLESSAQ